MAAAATSSVPASSAFLAPVGQTTHYRYSDLIATPKGLAAQIGAHAGGDISVPVAVTIPWASRPVLQPTLSIDMTKANSFTANAGDETSVNPPQQKKRSLLPFAFGLGILGGAVGGTPGRIVGTSATVLLAVMANVEGTLHLRRSM